MDNKLVVILGPTAVGKSKIGVEVASQINGHIISGDSMQIYKYMDIGTAKIKEIEMYGSNGVKVPHYMLDFVSPLKNYSVAEFQNDARKCIDKVNKLNAVPILLGGTGLYVRAVIDEYEFQDNIDINIRKKYRNLAEEKGLDYLHKKLKTVDPLTANKIHANDFKRILRALEYYEMTGRPISDQNKADKAESIYKPLVMIGLWMPRKILYERINKRVDTMIENGLIDEVRSLLKMGVKPSSTAMQAIGYRQIIGYLQGKYSKIEAIELIKRDTRRFAKRQITWFKKDSRIKWFEVDIKNPFSRINEIKAEIGRNIYI